MAQLPNDLPEDFRTKVWEQLYEELFKGPLRLPTSMEIADGLAARRVTVEGRHEVITREMIWEPEPSGWVWDRISGKTGCYDGKEITWFGIDYAEGFKPVRLPTEDDLAVHRAVAAMQRPTRANEL